MKIKINHGRIIGIEDSALAPILPTSNLSFIEDKDLYKEIRNYIKSDHRNVEDKLIFSDGVMKESNPRLAVAVDMFFKKHHPEYRLATQLDLEQNLEFTSGTYNDSGLALRNLTGDNSEQAKYIFEQLKKRGVKEKHFPIWIDLKGLELTSDLNFNLTDESFYKTAKCLNWESGTSYSKINDFGLPKEKDSSSSRQIWTDSNYALSRAFLCRGSSLDSDGSSLGSSGGNGRVVVRRCKAPELSQKM